MRSTSAVVRYEFKPPPRDVAGLPTFLNDELPKISTAVNFALDGQFEQQTVAPAKPREGMLRNSDGSQWALTRGKGFYRYDATAAEWQILVSVGSGGAVTQATSKSTAVTLDKDTGEVTMNNAALASVTAVTFTLNNSKIGANDLLLVTHNSGGTAFAYTVKARVTAAGVASINVRNDTGGSLSEAIVLRFTRIPGAVS